MWRTGRSVIIKSVCQLLRLYSEYGRQMKYECESMVE